MIEALERALRWQPSLGRRALLLWFIIGTALFSALVVFGLVEYRRLDAEVDPLLFTIAIAGGATVAVALNGAELLVGAESRGVRFSMRSAARISLIGSVTNVLPIPGAAVVRTGAVIRAGASTASTVTLAASTALAWAGATTLVVGCMPHVGRLWVAALGAITCVSGYGIFGRHAIDRPRQRYALLVVVEVTKATAEVGRVALLMAAMGLSDQLRGGAAIALANVAATATGLVPAGLGLREALAAALSVPLGLDTGSLVLVSGVDRLATFVIVAALTAAVAGPEALRAAAGARPR